MLIKKALSVRRKQCAWRLSAAAASIGGRDQPITCDNCLHTCTSRQLGHFLPPTNLLSNRLPIILKIFNIRLTESRSFFKRTCSGYMHFRDRNINDQGLDSVSVVDTSTWADDWAFQSKYCIIDTLKKITKTLHTI